MHRQWNQTEMGWGPKLFPSKSGGGWQKDIVGPPLSRLGAISPHAPLFRHQ